MGEHLLERVQHNDVDAELGCVELEGKKSSETNQQKGTTKQTPDKPVESQSS